MGKSATAYSSYGKHINLQYMSQSEYLSLTGSAHKGAMYLTSSGPGSNITSSYIMQLGPTGSDGLTVSAYKFKGDGSLLTGVVADIDGATDGTSITVAASDRLLISDSGTEKYIHVSQLDSVLLRSDQSDTFNGTLTATGRVMIDDTTEATSKTDGSLQTDGGLSVAKSAVIGKDLDLVENGAIINFGSSSPFVMTHAQANNAALVSSGHRLAFGDAGDYITGNGTDISIVGSNEINLDATTVDIDAAVSISGNTSGSTAQFAKLTASAGYFAELFVSGSTLHLGDTSISAAEIAPLDGITAGTVAASKAVVADSNKDVTGFRNVTMTGDMTAATVTMTGFTVDADGDTALKSLAVDDSSTIGCDSDADIMTLAAQSLTLANDVNFNVAKTGGLQLGGAAVTATAAELNLLDGVSGLVQADFTKLAAVDASASELNKLDGVTATTDQLNFVAGATAGTVAANKAVVVDSNKDAASFRNLTATGAITAGSFVIGSADMSEADLEQLDGITAGTVAASKAVVVDSNKDASGFRHVTATGAVTAGSLVIGSADINEAELETIDGVTAGTVAASKAVVVDSNKDASGFRNVTATGALTAGTSLIIGSADLNEADMEKLDGITNGTVAANKAVVADSNLDASGFRHVTATGALTAGTSLIIGSADLNEADMEKLDGITDGTGAANKALVLDANRNVGNINMLTASYAKIGELDVDLINTINKTETTLEILDKLIVVASGSNSANSDGAGLQFGSIQGTDNVASILYDHSNTGLDFNVAGSSEVLLTAGALSPASPDGNALGTTSLMWSDVFLADGAVINFNNSNVTMTHSSNLMTIAGGNTRVDRLEIDSANDYIDVDTDLKLVAAADIVLDPAGGDVKADGNLLPNSSNGGALGSTGAMWSDVFLADGAVINFNDSDVVMTHSANNLSVTGGYFQVERLRIDGSTNYLDVVSSDLRAYAAQNIHLDAASDIILDADNGSIQYQDGGTLKAQLNLADSGYSMHFSASAAGDIAWSSKESGKIMELDDSAAALMLNSTNKIQFAGTGNYVHQRATNVLELKAPTVEIDGATKIDLQSDAITLGTGGNTDVALTFAGASNSGALTWMEDEDEFKFDDDVMIADSKKLLFGNDSDATLGFDPTAGTDGLVLTSAKNVYLTTPSGVEPADFTPTFVISSFHNDDGKQSANNTGGGIVFAKSRAGSLMSDGDHIGGIRFRDGSGTHSFNYAQVYGIATDASGEEGSLAIECRVNSANVEVAQFGYKSGSTRYGLYLNNNADHGTIKAHSFITYSDETLKDNITPIDSGLDKVMALQGVTYDWKSDGTADIGFIAQEVEKVVPQAVYGKSDGEYGLDYGSLTSVLVEAVKEQQAQIEDLKAELKNKADK